MFTLGYVARFDPANFEEGQPVRTSDAYRLQMSLQHLIDQSPQCYINWAGKPDGDDTGSHIAVVIDATVSFSRSFPAIWWKPDRPNNFVLRVRARTSAVSANVTARARLLLDTGAAAPVLIDESAPVTLATSSTVISKFTNFDARPDLNPAWRPFPVIENVAFLAVPVPMFRLECSLTADASEPEQTMEICGLSLWGFT